MDPVRSMGRLYYYQYSDRPILLAKALAGCLNLGSPRDQPDIVINGVLLSSACISFDLGYFVRFTLGVQHIWPHVKSVVPVSWLRGVLVPKLWEKDDMKTNVSVWCTLNHLGVCLGFPADVLSGFNWSMLEFFVKSNEVEDALLEYLRYWKMHFGENEPMCMTADFSARFANLPVVLKNRKLKPWVITLIRHGLDVPAFVSKYEKMVYEFLWSRILKYNDRMYHWMTNGVRRKRVLRSKCLAYLVHTKFPKPWILGNEFVKTEMEELEPLMVYVPGNVELPNGNRTSSCGYLFTLGQVKEWFNIRGSIHFPYIYHVAHGVDISNRARGRWYRTVTKKTKDPSKRPPDLAFTGDMNWFTHRPFVEFVRRNRGNVDFARMCVDIGKLYQCANLDLLEDLGPVMQDTVLACGGLESDFMASMDTVVDGFEHLSEELPLWNIVRMSKYENPPRIKCNTVEILTSVIDEPSFELYNEMCSKLQSSVIFPFPIDDVLRSSYALVSSAIGHTTKRVLWVSLVSHMPVSKDLVIDYLEEGTDLEYKTIPYDNVIPRFISPVDQKQVIYYNRVLHKFIPNVGDKFMTHVELMIINEPAYGPGVWAECMQDLMDHLVKERVLFKFEGRYLISNSAKSVHLDQVRTLGVLLCYGMMHGYSIPRFHSDMWNLLKGERYTVWVTHMLAKIGAMKESDQKEMIGYYDNTMDYVRKTQLPDEVLSKGFVFVVLKYMPWSDVLCRLGRWWCWFERDVVEDLTVENIMSYVFCVNKAVVEMIEKSLRQMSVEDRAKWVQFVTGRKELPDRTEGLILVTLDQDTHLPKASTCANQLHLHKNLEDLGEEVYKKSLEYMLKVDEFTAE